MGGYYLGGAGGFLFERVELFLSFHVLGVSESDGSLRNFLLIGESKSVEPVEPIELVEPVERTQLPTLRVKTFRLCDPLSF